MRRSGVLLASLLLLSACRFPYSFKSGGLDIKTIAVIPFENKTSLPELQQELFEQMRRDLRRRLGVRDAPKETASAIAQGTIQEYQPDMPVGVSADRTQVSTRRRLQITIDIRIFDQKKGLVLYERRGLTATADYAERGEADARKQAIERIVNELVDGVQSQW
jgi:hypothetical protein